MPTTKLLSSDLDGTIIFERSISDADIAALQAWRNAGHLAVCNTGKSLVATKHALAAYSITFDYYVLFTGAVICDKDFKIIMEHHIATEVVQEILATLETQSDIGVYATTLETPDQQIFYTVDPTLQTDILQTSIPGSPRELESQKVIGIPIWAPNTTQGAALYTQLQKQFGDVVDIHKNQDFIDIVPPRANKGTGLKQLLEYLSKLGMHPETYSLGDSYNDLDMHAVATHAAAFDHSPEQVKHSADTITDTAAAYLYNILEQA